MVKKWIYTTAALLLLSSTAVQADDESGWDSFVQGIGQAVYFAAFPTATYKGVELKAIRPGANGLDVVFVVYGISAFDNDSLWTEAIITVRSGQIVDLRWGENNAILAQPGETMKNLGQLLEDLNKESRPSSSSSTVRMTWVLPNNCGNPSGIQVRFFDITKDLVWPSTDKVFTVAAWSTREISIDAERGDKICLGAAPYVDAPRTYWGVGIANQYDCKDCCYTADNTRVRWALSCG